MIGNFHRIIEAYHSNDILFFDDIYEDEEKYYKKIFKKHHDKAVCFNLGEIESWDNFNIDMDMVRLPYDVCWFESESYQSNKKLGCLSFINTIDSINHLNILALIKLPGVAWMFLGVIDMCPSDIVRGFEFSPPKAKEPLKEIMQIVSAFLSALNCNNVSSVENKPPEKLQKKRAKRGKTPLFSYWTLHLDAPGNKQQKPGETNDPTRKRPPRLHLRRGHIRQYKPGQFTWVNPCVVGDKKAGMVNKDYYVRAQEER